MREWPQRASPNAAVPRALALLGAAALAIAACGTDPTETSTEARLQHTSVSDTAGLVPADLGRIGHEANQSPTPFVNDEPVVDGIDQDRMAPTVDGSVTIAFGGDIHFESYLRTRLVDGPNELLSPVAEMMADADIAVANLETTITERGTPTAKTYNFRAPPVAFDALRAAGIDVVSMANNHGLDFGIEGLEDSLASADEAGFPVVGIGRNAADAYAPWTAEVNGQRIAIIGATQVLDSSLMASWTAAEDQAGLASAKEVDRLTGAVAQARGDHDTVVVFLHWGIEGETCPADRQLTLSDRLIEAGADVIVGGHAHRVQGGGRKGDAVVHYGLGNFVFYTDTGPGTESGVLLVTVTGRTVDEYEWVPAQLRSGVATRLEGEEAAAATDQWERLRDCTDLER
ncbi:MAG: CapA family protein [Acidimicrobiales bacterium]